MGELILTHILHGKKYFVVLTEVYTMTTTILLFIAGLVILIVGADLLVRGAARLAGFGFGTGGTEPGLDPAYERRLPRASLRRPAFGGSFPSALLQVLGHAAKFPRPIVCSFGIFSWALSA